MSVFSEAIEEQLRWMGAGDTPASLGLSHAAGRENTSPSPDPCDGCDYCTDDWPAGAIGCPHRLALAD